MITVRYKSIIINGVDKSGKMETLPNEEAMRLVKYGHATIVNETAVVEQGEKRISQEIKPKKKKRYGFKA